MSPMFDREPNFEDTFKVGDRFVLMNLQYTGTIRTRMGEAHRSIITAVTRDSYPGQTAYSVIGVGFRNMAERSVPADFPVVVEYVRVSLPGGKDVKRLARVMNGELPLTPADFIHAKIDGDPIDMAQFDSSVGESAPSDSGEGPGF